MCIRDSVDTVVTQEDVVTSENLVDDGTQTATVLTNATTGTTVTLNDEGVPLSLIHISRRRCPAPQASSF